MKAVGHYKALPIDHVDALIDIDLSEPPLGRRDLLVKVEAISVNPADYRVRGRKVDDGQIAILGWDVAGIVAKIGEDVQGFQVGDAVYYAGDLTRPGANSELHAVDYRIVGHRPTTLPASEAAALPLTLLTAWEALFERFHISRHSNEGNRTILIIGGAGGAGSVAIQLARLASGLTVVATASRPQSQAWCRSLGAHHVVDHFGDIPEQLAELGHPQVEMVLILNDPDKHYPTAAQVVAPQGAICSIVPFERAPDINLIMRKSATFVWEFMFTRSMFATADIAKQGSILNDAAELIDSGKLKSTVSEIVRPINARNLRDAHARLEAGRMIGKLVLADFE